MKHLVKLFYLLFAVALAACGTQSDSGQTIGQQPGTTGGTTTPTTPPVVTPPAATVVLSTPPVITSSSPGNITATVTNSAGAPIANQLVSFVISTPGGVTSAVAVSTVPATGAATTNASGQAVITISADNANTSGVGLLTVNVLDASGGTVATTNTLFTVASPTSVTPTLRFVTDKQSIMTGNVDAAALTLSVVDSNNQSLSNVAVAISASSGSLTSVSATTNAAGIATANLSSGDDATLRAITVTATVNGVTETLSINTTSTSMTTSGETSVVAGANVPITVTLRDGQNVALNNQAIVVSNPTNTFAATTVTTDANGEAVFNVQSVASTETFTFTALSGSVTTTHVLNVTPVGTRTIQILSPADSANLQINTAHTITAQLSDSAASVASIPLVVSSSKGDLDPGTAGIQGVRTINTDGSGNISLTVQSTGDIGAAVISVVEQSNTSIQASRNVNFISGTPGFIRIEAAPSTVTANDTSRLVATVLDTAGGNPIAGQLVLFNIAGAQDGRLLAPSAITGSDGRATVNFTAGSSSTETDAVTATATLSSNTSLTATTNLTITSPLLNITLGTGNTLIDIDSVSLEQRYDIFVSDGLGRAAGGATVNVVIVPRFFYKGRFIRDGNDWVQVRGTMPETVEANDTSLRCPAEDTNQNNVLDAGEDLDNDGELDPAGAALIIATPTVDVNGMALPPTVVGGSITVDANGRGRFAITYPKSNAFWADLEIRATATLSSEEATSTILTEMPGLAADYLTANGVAPGVLSLYGTELNCTNPL